MFTWYQSRTACRKPILLVDVVSSVVKTIYNLKMSCENLLRFLFTPYPLPSNLGDILSLFDLTVLLLVCNILIFRSTGLASTFSLLVSSARLLILMPEERKYCGSSRHSFALVQDLEPKVPDCARALV